MTAMERSIAFKDRRGVNRWTDTIFTTLTASCAQQNSTSAAVDPFEEIREYFDIIAEGESRDEVEALSLKKSMRDKKRNTRAIHRGKFKLELADHKDKNVYALPSFFYTLSDKDVKYALTSLTEEKEVVVGRVVCCGPYHLYRGLCDAGLDIKPATSEELKTTNVMRKYILFHEKLRNNIKLMDTMKKINLRDPLLYFEADTPTGNQDKLEIQALLIAIKRIRIGHKSTLDYYGELVPHFRDLLKEEEMRKRRRYKQ